MKKKCFYYVSVLFICSLLASTIQLSALNYSINFTGSGDRTEVDSVIIRNITKGTDVIVRVGGTLNLIEVANDIEKTTSEDESIRIYPNTLEGKFTVSFYAKQTGDVQINALSLDGRKIAGVLYKNLQIGKNTFELSLPQGMFLIQVLGNKYNYSAKAISQTCCQEKTRIVFIGTEKLQNYNLQKSSSPLEVNLEFSADDNLVYKGFSGNCRTIVTDKPTSSKTVNFNFVVCQDANGNNYSVVSIGSRIWMAENLHVEKFNNGDLIPIVTSNDAWVGANSPGVYNVLGSCAYNNNYNNDSISKYGLLYNINVVTDVRGITPVGWHIANDTDWHSIMNLDIINTSGFTPLLAGYRDNSGIFHGRGNYTNWLGSENMFIYTSNGMFSNVCSGQIWRYHYQYYGYSIRCVKN